MPEFVMPGKDNDIFGSCDDFTKGYVEALFFTEEERLCEESEGERETPGVLYNSKTHETRFDGPNAYGADDLSPEAWALIKHDCHNFQELYRHLWVGKYPRGTHWCEDAQAGHDFWLTRNGHGVGFRDRGLGEVGEQLAKLCGWRTPFGEVDVYLGDDGKVHLA